MVIVINKIKISPGQRHAIVFFYNFETACIFLKRDEFSHFILNWPPMELELNSNDYTARYVESYSSANIKVKSTVLKNHANDWLNLANH